MAYVPGFEYDIFLSYASDDLDDNLKTFFNDLRIALRRQLGKDFSDEHSIFLDRNELNQMGFRLEPQTPSAYHDRDTIRTLLGKAKLAIHFVGGQESQRPLDAIRDSRQYCQYSTLVYEAPGVDLSADERFSLEWLEDD